jgi:hypothetical protein
MPKKRRAAPKQATSRRKAGSPTPGASPINGVVPPIESRFQPGKSGNPNGRPRKLQDLKELILSTLAEEMTVADADGKRTILTRAQAMIRTMLIKSPTDRIALLEYAFGKVTQPYRDDTPREKIIGLLRDGKVLPAEVRSTFGDEYAAELLESAGISDAESRGVGAAGAESENMA